MAPPAAMAAPSPSRSRRPWLLDLERHYAFYGAYHADPANVAIHVACVWPIFFTALMLLDYTPPLLSLPFAFPGSEYVVVNAAFAGALAYAVLYILLDPRAGLVAAALIAACCVLAQAAFQALGRADAWKVAVGVNVLCWVAQFVGHGIFEKRAPALLDNLAQALLFAQFFVLLEVLEKSFGYEPNPGFKDRVQSKVTEDIKAHRAKKGGIREPLISNDQFADPVKQ